MARGLGPRRAVRKSYAQLYDPFARLIAKRVLSPSGAIASRTRLVWDKDQAVHEIVARLDRADPIVEERTYSYLPGRSQPLAHRVVEVNGSRREQGWVHYLTDRSSRPEALLDGSGRILARYQSDAWGRLREAKGSPGQASTPLRFAGHREDGDTGLFYNRYRHYDPETGRYLSPEPLGLLGGLRPFAYAEGNPINFVDPDGLAGMTATASGGGVSVTRGSAGTEGNRGADELDDLHPAVQAALLPPGQSMESARNGMRHPAACAEPRAVSDFLKANKVPPDASPEEVGRVLSQMQIGANQADNGRARAPCRNCSQFLANLNAMFGAPSPEQVTPGFGGARGNGEQTNFTPPNQPGMRTGIGTGATT